MKKEEEASLINLLSNSIKLVKDKEKDVNTS